MKRVGAVLLVAAALSLLVWQGVASASEGQNVSWAIRGVYACSDTACDNTTGSGTGFGPRLGAMT